MGTAERGGLRAGSGGHGTAAGATGGAVLLKASVESYSATYGWTAAIFAVGLVATVLLYKRGVPRHDDSAMPAVHM
ncbi:hypothetical protein [Streptomyces solaniscabiei]|uniref:hypothetical protein n=1 Tax=Streptomyces solaniscabiei TaxID=2683255 RepID=UPI001CE2E3F8|nr:hypothetical protein [Streptomyces solaniscabiei]